MGFNSGRARQAIQIFILFAVVDCRCPTNCDTPLDDCCGCIRGGICFCDFFESDEFVPTKEGCNDAFAAIADETYFKAYQYIFLAFFVLYALICFWRLFLILKAKEKKEKKLTTQVYCLTFAWLCSFIRIVFFAYDPHGQSSELSQDAAQFLNTLAIAFVTVTYSFMFVMWMKLEQQFNNKNPSWYSRNQTRILKGNFMLFVVILVISYAVGFVILAFIGYMSFLIYITCVGSIQGNRLLSTLKQFSGDKTRAGRSRNLQRMTIFILGSLVCAASIILTQIVYYTLIFLDNVTHPRTYIIFQALGRAYESTLLITVLWSLGHVVENQKAKNATKVTKTVPVSPSKRVSGTSRQLAQFRRGNSSSQFSGNSLNSGRVSPVSPPPHQNEMDFEMDSPTTATEGGGSSNKLLASLSLGGIDEEEMKTTQTETSDNKEEEQLELPIRQA